MSVLKAMLKSGLVLSCLALAACQPQDELAENKQDSSPAQSHTVPTDSADEGDQADQNEDSPIDQADTKASQAEEMGAIDYEDTPYAVDLSQVDQLVFSNETGSSMYVDEAYHSKMILEETAPGQGSLQVYGFYDEEAGQLPLWYDYDVEIVHGPTQTVTFEAGHMLEEVDVEVNTEIRIVDEQNEHDFQPLYLQPTLEFDEPVIRLILDHALTHQPDLEWSKGTLTERLNQDPVDHLHPIFEDQNGAETSSQGAGDNKFVGHKEVVLMAYLQHQQLSPEEFIAMDMNLAGGPLPNGYFMVDPGNARGRMIISYDNDQVAGWYMLTGGTPPQENYDGPGDEGLSFDYYVHSLLHTYADQDAFWQALDHFGWFEG